MKKIIALGGEPATGKSTVLISLINQLTELYGQPEEIQPVKLIPCVHWEEQQIYILGKYHEGEMFPGTDKMAMNCQPRAVEFFESLKDSNATIIFEGDRLFNGSFLNHLLEHYEDFLDVVILESSEETKKFRHKDRNDSQDEKFLKGRKTKYQKIQSNMLLMPYLETWQNESMEDSQRLVEKLINSIKDQG